MFARFAIGVLGLTLSLAATAQDLPSLAIGNEPETSLVDQLLAIDTSAASEPGIAPVVPIWSGSDGHLLALVAIPGQWGSPLLAGTTGQAGRPDWSLLGPQTSSGGGLRWQANNGFHADVLFSQYANAMPSISLCGAGCGASTLQGGAAGSLGLGWMSPGGGLDLSYGLSWLQASDPTVGALSAPGADVPVLTLPSILTSGMQSGTSLFAHGRWRFDENAAIDVGASYGHGRAMPFGSPAGVAPGIDLDQLSLSLGLDAGSLRGAVVGHVLRSDDPLLVGKKWTTLDLGVSWRTPWRAEISVGAQNLWSAPLDTPRDADPAQSRMPYIQYRQDL